MDTLRNPHGGLIFFSWCHMIPIDIKLQATKKIFHWLIDLHKSWGEIILVKLVLLDQISKEFIVNQAGLGTLQILKKKKPKSPGTVGQKREITHLCLAFLCWLIKPLGYKSKLPWQSAKRYLVLCPNPLDLPYSGVLPHLKISKDKCSWQRNILLGVRQPFNASALFIQSTELLISCALIFYCLVEPFDPSMAFLTHNNYMSTITHWEAQNFFFFLCASYVAAHGERRKGRGLSPIPLEHKIHHPNDLFILMFFVVVVIVLACRDTREEGDSTSIEGLIFFVCETGSPPRPYEIEIILKVPQCLFCPFSRLIPCKKIQEGGIHLICPKCLNFF
ncbi:hypothetical protein VP01_3184g1 [Puccinia sorghi]|uniref:Uncharacterized protein n=1 Tax=Puccinia sorghi TaxID=27349 RepID=A0A0L6UYR2_9BASI|nr:hypothetical protein VP01_3184g1 [Puccinia sorghi]